MIIKTVFNKILRVKVDIDDTIYSIRKKINKKYKLDDFILLHKGYILNDNVIVNEEITKSKYPTMLINKLGYIDVNRSLIDIERYNNYDITEQTFDDLPNNETAQILTINQGNFTLMNENIFSFIPANITFQNADIQEEELTENDEIVINRIADLGFNIDVCREAYILCNKDENKTINYLLDS